MADLAVLRSGSPDPGVPGAQLAALNTAALRAVAVQIAATARALGSGASSLRQAIGELVRGWSAPPPRVGVGRLLQTVEQTAAMLVAHSAAIDSTCSVIERAKSNAQLDVTLALAEFRALQQNSWPELLGGIVGAPQLADAVRLAGIARRLNDALTAKVETVRAAVASLGSTLAGDPTAGPDSLRGGPDALLPPDPVMNPAHRTDQQNRAALAGDLRSGDPARIKFAISILQSLQTAGDRTTAQLLVYDSQAFGRQGRAAISVGDLTTATNVAVVVPGISNSPSSMSGGLGLADDLREEANRQDPGEQTAVVAWYGYDIPMSWTKDPASGLITDVRDTLAIGSAGSAASGAPLLATDLWAIKAMSQVSARITVLGHSMGSTTVSEAAAYRLPVDSIVLMGSPGAGWHTDSAAGYHNIPASAVYVLSYDQDPVTRPVTDRAAGWLGRPDPFGPDPASDSFGGRHIDVTTNVPAVGGIGLLSLIFLAAGDPRHHSMKNYMQGRALVAEGAIVVGRKDEVPTKAGR